MRRLAILLPALLAFQVGVQPALAWTWPVDGPVLQTFNVDENSYAAGQHRGIDVGAPVGTAVLAPAAGKVSFAGSVAANGPTVTIQTADGLSVTLVQLGTVGVAKGSDLAEGVPVGTVGPSGNAEIAEPHVHLGIRRTSDPNGYLDPLGFLPARAASQPSTEPVSVPKPAPAPAPAAGEPAPPSSPGTEPSPARPARARPSPKTSNGPGLSSLPRTIGRVHTGAWGGQLDRTPIRALRRVLDPFEPAPLHPAAAAAAAAPSLEHPSPILFAVIALAAALAAGLAVLRRQLFDANAADRPASVLLERIAATAEDAHGLRLGEENRLVLDGDLEGILLSEAEALADLDWNHDPTELVNVADDPRPRRSSQGGGRCLDRLPGSHGRQARPIFGPGSRLSVPARCAF
jgi:Peptidase family M23